LYAGGREGGGSEKREWTLKKLSLSTGKANENGVDGRGFKGEGKDKEKGRRKRK